MQHIVAMTTCAAPTRVGGNLAQRSVARFPAPKMRSAAAAAKGRSLCAAASIRCGAASGFVLSVEDQLVQKGAQVKILTEKECAVGISIYPDFAYNAEGGVALGIINAVLDDKLAVSFDASTLSIPPVESGTADIMGLPLPPLFKVEIIPRSLEGFIELRTGKVELQLDAEFIPTVKPVYTSAPIKLAVTLTTETTWGAVRSARGKRIDSEGRCVLVGVARVPPTSDPLVSATLLLPTDALILLQARFEFTKGL